MLVIMHAAVTLIFKILFFNYYVVDPVGGDDPLSDSPGGDSTSSVASSASATMTALFRWSFCYYVLVIIYVIWRGNAIASYNQSLLGG